MALVRSTLFHLIFYGGTLLYIVVGLIAAAIGERPMKRIIFAWGFFFLWSTRRVLGIRLVVEGEMPRGGNFFVSKHESIYETIALLPLLDAPAFILKRQLAEIPGWGWLAKRYGVIPVDQAGGATAMRAMLTAARDMRDSGRAIVIFPEGTRVPVATEPPLRPGLAGLYQQLRLPVVAIAVQSGHVWPRQSWIRHPGTVTMRFSEPIPTMLSRSEIEKRVHVAINALNSLPR